MEVTIKTGFTQKTCITCGVIHFIPDEMERHLRDTGRTYYCPSGHTQAYVEGDAAKYKRLYEKAEEYRQNAVDSAKALRDQLEKCQAKNQKPKRIKK